MYPFIFSHRTPEKQVLKRNHRTLDEESQVIATATQNNNTVSNDDTNESLLPPDPKKWKGTVIFLTIQIFCLYNAKRYECT